jgi:hypothetical protein
MKWRGWLPFLLPLEKITATVAVNAKGATEEEEKCADKKDIAVVDVYAPFRLFFSSIHSGPEGRNIPDKIRHRVVVF